MKLKVSVADVGKWFNEFVLERGEELVDIKARATEFQPALLREVLTQVREAREMSPSEALFVLELAEAHVSLLVGVVP